MESKASRAWEQRISPKVLWLLLQFKYTYVTGLYKLKDFLRHQNPVVVRGIFGTASVLFATSLVVQPATFERPGFVHLRGFLGLWPDAPAYASSLIWATLFYLHALGLILIAVYEPKKDTWPIIVNSFGLSMWMISSLALNWAVHAFSPGVSMEISACAFGTWALYSTELSKKTVHEEDE